MKVSPLSPPSAAAERQDGPGHDDSDAANSCGLKRRRLHSQTNTIDNLTFRHRKRLYPRHDNRSTSTGRYDGNGCNSGDGDASDCDDDPSNIPGEQRPAEEGTSSSPSRHNKKTAVINNNNNVNDGNETNKTTLEPTMSSNPVKSTTTINENYPTVTDTDFDHTVAANDHVVNSETSNCLSQSPLNLTRSQGSSEEDGKSDYDEDEYDDDNEEKNNFDNVVNDDGNNIINGHNLPAAEAPFPWNITLGHNNNNNNDNYKNNKDNNDNVNGNNGNNNKRHHNDKIAVPSASPPQLLLTSGHLTTGCLQAAQLLIPTARGIMTQTILAIPINDMVSSEITASGSTQRQLLHHHSLNNVSQKNVNRQQLGQTYCRPQLPLDRYFQHRTADDETNASDNGHNDDTATNSATAADNQRRKWQHADLNSKKHSFLPPQQKQSLRAKNVETGDEPTGVQRSKDCSAVQTPAGTNGDNHRIYSNGAFGYTECNSNADLMQRQTAWPTSLISASDPNGSDENENEGKLYPEDKPQAQHSHGVATSPANISTLKSLAPSSSQLNCPLKESKYDSTAAAAYSQQNAICTALATHMMCASQLAQQPMFDSTDNGNAAKKPNHYNNNNNNNHNHNNNNNNNNDDNDNDNDNDVKASNSIMGAVNPAVLEKWMMEERYYYNNSKSMAAGHGHNQRYNSTVSAVAVAAAAAVELLNVSTSPSGDGLAASCKKRKRRTSFTPQALELLNGHFERNTHPSGSEITGLAHRLGYEREVIRIWFCNKRQALKNTVRSINGPTHNMTTTKSHNNTSGY